MNIKQLTLFISIGLIGCTSQADKDRAKMQGLINKRDAMTLKLDSTMKLFKNYKDLSTDIYMHKLDSFLKISSDLDPNNGLVDSSLNKSEKLLFEKRHFYSSQSVQIEDSLKIINKEIEDFKLIMGK